MKRRFEDPDERVGHGKVLKIALSRPGVKEKLREAQKKRYEKPAERVKLSKIMKKRYEDPELRVKLSEAIRRGWQKRKQGGGDPGNQIS